MKTDKVSLFEEISNLICTRVCEFKMHNNDRDPSLESKNVEERYMAEWLENQREAKRLEDNIRPDRYRSYILFSTKGG